VNVRALDDRPGRTLQGSLVPIVVDTLSSTSAPEELLSSPPQVAHDRPSRGAGAVPASSSGLVIVSLALTLAACLLALEPCRGGLRAACLGSAS
jgi:hypothetical protein